MIIIRLDGGLGNQLFQYAIARKLSLTAGTSLAFDTSSFQINKLRKYNLGNFNVEERFATPVELALFGRRTEDSFKSKFYTLVGKLLGYCILNDKEFNYQENIVATTKKNVFLKGYFQSSKYFEDISQILLKDLTISNKLFGRNLEVANQIKSVTSVSVHIRRGDYITNSKTLEYHGVCNIEYYLKAIEQLSSALGRIVLFVFSDDISWVKNNLKTNFETFYVDHNGDEKNYEDLRLMSFCKHNIIANSSFSWWGAWLNTNPDKIVVAPKQWFADPGKNSHTNDLIPSNWIRP